MRGQSAYYVVKELKSVYFTNNITFNLFLSFFHVKMSIWEIQEGIKHIMSNLKIMHIKEVRLISNNLNILAFCNFLG